MKESPHFPKLLQVSQINDAEFNPTPRTKESAVTALKSSVQKNGILSPIHVLDDHHGHDYMLIDGHRRITVARILQIPTVQAIVHKGLSRKDAPRLWAELNRPVRVINGAEWFEFWYRTGGTSVEDQIPNGIRSDIRTCVSIFGGTMEGVRFLVEHQPRTIAPNVARQIVGLHRAMERKATSLQGPVPSTQEIGYWIVKHRMQAFIMSVLRMPEIPLGYLRKIARRIRRDMPCDLIDLTTKRTDKF